ncbi:MAG: hypothetical protein A3G81_25860 [Betaproteobacteria bacterium RIFCSPLOWO2_12_FULL_65_14]|nr:MAG: hypothetical protein A3G81_25860 [Betaproteobacteria bacterium RIFCSPLOWO2_12_FULL_65_14]
MATAAALAIAVAVGYALHLTAKKRAEERALVSVLTDATAQLRQVFKAPAPGALEKIEAGLRLTKDWSNAEVTDATQHYLIGAREILRRRADSLRFTEKAAASRAALAEHMKRAAGRRGGSWFRTASDLKKQVERDHFDLELSLKTLAELLDTLPDAHKRLAPHVQASLLLEDSARKEARAQVVEEARRAAGELEKARRLQGR